MDKKELEKLAQYYDTHDMSAELETAQSVTAVPTEPFITTSLRLPRPVMQELRQVAAARGVKPTLLMREWIEAALAEEASIAGAVIPVATVRSMLGELVERAITSAHTVRTA
jgi:hypothetical protein